MTNQKTQEIKASLNYLRIAPRKVRAVASIIKGLPVDVAQAKLFVISRRAKEPILKLLQSAISNAKNNYHLEPTKLFVKSILVNNGPMFKRWTPRARGSVNLIQKKTSHLQLVLGVAEKEVANKFNLLATKKKVKKPKEEKSKEIKEKKEELKEEKKFKKEQKPKEETESVKRIFRRKAI